MDPLTAGSLAALALIDSTSFGTLLIPIWLLLNPGRIRVGRLVFYLGTIVVAYAAIGAVLITGGRSLGGWLAEASTSPVLGALQLAVGVALVVISFRMDTPEARERGNARVTRWRAKVSVGHPGGGLGALAVLALGAVAIEAASMLPYLGAIGLMTASDLPPAALGITLLVYCLVMVTPALLLMVVRLVARQAVEPLLQRVDGWLTRNAAGATSWIVGIVGFLVALDAFGRVGTPLLAFLDNL
ncbi:GAP family protein [Propionibacteriaceae bacterium Y2011]